MQRYPWTNENGDFPREYNWAFASKCRAFCRYCNAYESYTAKVAAGERWWSDDEAVTAWAAIAELWGEGVVYFTGLEPGCELPLVGRVLRHHRGFVQTNLTFEPDECKRELPADRAKFQPTFHPHLWHFDAGRFVERVELLRAAGFFIDYAALLADPRYISRLPEYVQTLRAAGLCVNVSPIRDAVINGRALPGGYTDEENATIAEFSRLTLFAPDSTFHPLRIVACGAGMHVVTIGLNGDVWRCVQQRGNRGNFIRDKGINWAAGPEPCPEKTCRCGQLHRFHITESVGR